MIFEFYNLKNVNGFVIFIDNLKGKVFSYQDV